MLGIQTWKQILPKETHSLITERGKYWDNQNSLWKCYNRGKQRELEQWRFPGGNNSWAVLKDVRPYMTYTKRNGGGVHWRGVGRMTVALWTCWAWDTPGIWKQRCTDEQYTGGCVGIGMKRMMLEQRQLVFIWQLKPWEHCTTLPPTAMLWCHCTATVMTTQMDHSFIPYWCG